MTLYQGEVRQVGIEVLSLASDDFTIDAAEYLITNKNNEELENGFPTIEGHKITTLFNAQEKGVFYVTFKYHIGPEIFKAKVLVEVV